jgi:hypothetical protein
MFDLALGVLYALARAKMPYGPSTSVRRVFHPTIATVTLENVLATFTLDQIVTTVTFDRIVTSVTTDVSTVTL